MKTLHQKLVILFTTTVFGLSFGVINLSHATIAKADTLLTVPFSTQAPLGEWNDPRQSEGCEEASVAMAWVWATGTPLSPEQMRMYITGMSDFEQYFFGYYKNSSAEDTAKLMTEYFGYPYVAVIHNITLLDIKTALNSNELVIVPINPRIISTKYFNRYTINHTVVVIGYDDSDNTVIINDPLHYWGGNLKIAQDIFESSLADYSSGQSQVTDYVRDKSMIVISKPAF